MTPPPPLRTCVPVLFAAAALLAAAAPAAASPGTRAVAKARATGERVEVTAQASELRKVYANPDGTFTAKLFSQPVQVRRDGDWVAVETTLAVRPDGTVAPRAIAGSLALSGGDRGEPLARFAARGQSVELGWPGDLPKPTLKGDTATYRDVRPGVDLQVRATPTGFAPRLLVRRRSAARHVKRVRFEHEVDARGEELAIDVGDPGMPEGDVASRMTPEALTIVPDAGVLGDPDTVYPLAIAPPDYNRPIWESGWAKVMSGHPGNAYWLGGVDGGEAKIGLCGWAGCNGIGTVRSFFQYDHGGFLFGKNIIRAWFNARAWHSVGCGHPRWVDLWQTDPIGPGTNWHNQPWWWSRVHLGNAFGAWGGGSACPPAWLGWDVGNSVRHRVAQGSNLFTFALTAGDDINDAYGWKKFDWNPSLTVHYNTPPTVGGEETDGRQCTIDPNEPHTGDPSPRLSAIVADADAGALVQAHFQWFVRFQPNRVIGETLTAERSSGSRFGVDIPEGHFRDGDKISFRVRGFDGRDYGPFGRWCDITLDTSGPVKEPAVTSEEYPERRQSGAPGVTGRFRLARGQGETDSVVGFKYSLVNSPPDTYVAAPSGSVEIPLTPPETGSQWLHVRSIDKAGNPGPIKHYNFIVGLPTPPVGHWRLDGRHTNTSAPDATGNGRDGTLSGGHSWGTGRVRDALRFDGTGGHVRTTGGPPIRTDQSFTVAAWVRVDGQVPHPRTMVSIDGNRASGFYLQWSHTMGWSFLMTHRDEDEAIGDRVTAPFRYGRWTHLAGVQDAGSREIRLYVDGKLHATAPRLGTWAANGALQIGRAKWNGLEVDHFAGLIDDVKVYQRALPQREIGALATRPALEDGRWMLDEESGNRAADASGNLNPATASGGVTWGAPGPDGTAVRLDGTGSLGTAGPVLRTDSSFTVSGWVYADTFGHTRTAISQDGGERSAFLLGYRHESRSWSLFMPGTDVGGGDFPHAVAAVPPQTGEWTHLAAVHDLAAHELRIYVNGERSGTAPLPAGWTGWQANGPLRIGRAKWGSPAVDHWDGAIDDVRVHAGVRTDQEILREFLAVPPKPETVHSGAIARYINHAGEHLTASGPVPRGYRLEALYGLPAVEGAPNTRMLHVCKNGDETFTSGQADCEGQPWLGELGRVYVAPQPGLHLRPLYRCKTSAGGEHFDSTSTTCEGRVVEGLLGYVRAYVPIAGHAQPDPPRDRRTSIGPVPVTYEPRERFGIVSLVAGEGLRAVHSCQDGADAFTSLDEACEGKQYNNRLGYVWTERPAGVEAVPLLRCRDDETGERYDTTEDDCGGELLGYVAANAAQLRSLLGASDEPRAGGGGSSAGPDGPPPIDHDPGPTVATTGVAPRENSADPVLRVSAGRVPRIVPIVRSAPAGAEVSLVEPAPPGATGPALDVEGASGALTVDYSRFRNAYGADWGSRLRLVQLEAGEAVPVRSRNDAEEGTVTAQVQAGETYGLAGAGGGPTGDYKATPLSPSGSWQVSRQTGDFTWSEPVGTPRPVPGGFAPEFALSYASGTVDGRVANTNNQPSWIGEGWDLGSGFVERRYKACADDLAPGQAKTGDLCWETDNATLSLGGRSSELVKVGENRWRPVDDDGSRIERLTGAANGAREGEHWRVTTPDGTQHHFGLQRPPGGADTGSTWTVPVFGNDAGEPCKGATFAASSCTQAWRWNLDYSVDRRGNSITYYYAPETNAYGLNEGASKATYVRGGTLARAEFGARRGADPTARTVFHTSERCVGGGATCARTSMPDVPWDQHCDTATCPGKFSPTFWSTKRLAKVTSEVRSGGGWTPIDEWTLAHSFPAPGDGTTPALWLDSVTHTGLAGAAGVASPPVRFVPAPYNNRVDTSADGLPPMTKFRISTVRTPAGGEVNVVYDRDCDPAALPAAHNNTTRCYPIRWTPEGEFNPRNDWFAKYTVRRITEDDRVGGGDLMVTNYEYLGGAGWRYNDDELVTPEYRTWSRYRGYERVVVTHGDHTVAGAVRSKTQYRYHRGMHGDRESPAGGTRTATVQDARGTEIDDADQLAGFLREEIVYDGVDGPEVSATFHEPHQRQTGAQGALRSHQVDVARTRTRTAVPGGQRTTLVEYEYNDDGLVTRVDDRGDESTTEDDECRRTWYARDEAAWVLGTVSRDQTVGVPCSTPAALSRDAIAETRTYYDGGALHEPPTTGTTVSVEELDSFDGPTPRFVTTATTTIDAYGRAVASVDALGRRTSSSFAPETGLPTSSTETNPKGHRTTTTYEPLRGLPATVADVDNNRTTTLAYDAAGRLTGVWLPGRRNVFGPNTRYRYNLHNSGASWIAIDSLTPNGAYTTSYTLLDGFLRERQTQAPGSGGGRVFTSTHYDSRGLPFKVTGPEHATGAPSGDLIDVPDAQAHRQTLTTYDGVGRPTASIFRSLGQEQWRTTTQHHGNGTSVDPPEGGTPERVFADVRGRVVRRLQYRGSEPAGEHETTEYAYDDAGHLVSLTDAMGNRWRYEYDLRGLRVRTVDPDAGTSTYEYDDAGQLVRSSDGRDRTLAYAYDELGRKTAVHAGSRDGTKLAEWTYDTLAGGTGLPTGSTRFVEGAAYSTQVTAYDAASGRPLGSRVTIPAAETGLSGSYTTSFGYRPDGSPDATRLPKLGSLAAETVSHTYDAQGRPLGLSSALATYVDATKYSWFGDRTQLTLGPEGAEVWHTQFYDEATGRLSRAFTQRRVGETSVDDTTYGYDPAGNLTRISAGFVETTDEDQCFSYDYARRLTEAWTSTAGCGGAPGSSLGGPAPYWTSWRYDAAGNRRSEVQHAPGGVTTRTYEYPAAGSPQPHAVRSVTTTGPAGTRTESFSYDASGNTTAMRGQDLEWDVEGHLASMGSTRFVYDADGNRLIRRDANGKTLYLPGGELRSTAEGRTGTRYYDHGGETVAVRDRGGLHYLVGDHHETSEIRIDARTLDAVKRRTDPFGNPRGTRPAWPGSRGFVGGVEDPTGLTHLGAREYDPALGRFISVDPLIDVNDPQQVNGYAYANNSPATLSDPDGLIAARCPDGECRFGGHKKNQSPAARFNNRRRAVGTRCPDGARSCWAARGSYAKPFVKKPKPVAPVVKRSRWQRAANAFAGFMDSSGFNPTFKYVRPHIDRAVANVVGVDRDLTDETSSEYGAANEIGEKIGAAATRRLGRRGPRDRELEGENIVYRGLAPGEDPARGLTARNPMAGNDVPSHVAGARDTQWISTTKDLAIARERFGQQGVVAIDLNRVSNQVVDASDGIPGMNPNYMLSRWARKNREVLIQGYVPPEAVWRVP
jgi:RHS repeat-associated protein